MGEFIQLKAKDGNAFSAYKVMPAGKPKGGVVVVQEIFGVNHHIQSVADDYAAHGYLAIAPALFDRVEKGVELGYGDQGREKGFAIMGKSPMDTVLLDMEAAIAAASEGGKVFVVGYCWGGRIAYATAKTASVAAAVGYYGGGIPAILGTLKSPLELHFGEQDTHIPLSDVEKVRQAHPDIPIHLYPAGHGFNCDERDSYDKPSADLAKQRTLDFFAQHL